MSDPITIPLSAPITAHGETLSELVLRRPTVKELRTCGQPYRMHPQGGGGADYDACAKLIGMICGLPPSAVDQLDGADFDEIAMRLVGFMQPARPEANGSGSLSPIS